MQMSRVPSLRCSPLSGTLLFQFWPPQQSWIPSIFLLLGDTSALYLDSSSCAAIWKMPPDRMLGLMHSYVCFLSLRIKPLVLSVYKVWFLFCARSTLVYSGRSVPITNNLSQPGLEVLSIGFCNGNWDQVNFSITECQMSVLYLIAWHFPLFQASKFLRPLWRFAVLKPYGS